MARRWRRSATALAVAVLVTVLGVAPGASSDAAPPFPDVPSDHVFAGDVSWAAGAGLVAGRADGRFDPDGVVTRQEMVSVLHGLVGRPHVDPLALPPPFADVGADSPFAVPIAWAAAEGITLGRADGTFGPTEPVTRQAAAALLVRLTGTPQVVLPSEDGDGDAPGGDAMPSSTPAPGPFVDVPVAHPFFDPIVQLASVEVAQGYGDGTYRPGLAVRRAQLVGLVAKLSAQPSAWAPGTGPQVVVPPPRGIPACTDFGSWRLADRWWSWFAPDLGDPAGLDPDGDRVPCEDLPDASEYPTQDPRTPWPTETWPEAALPPGADADALDAAADAAFDTSIDATAGTVDALLVVHRGAIVYERYHPDLDPQVPHPSFSMGKSMTSAFIGLLVEEGRLDLDEPAPVPEWADPDDPRHDITIRHLLRMSSGLAFTERYYDGSSDVVQMLVGAGKDDMGAYAASKPLQHAPGTVYSYSTGTTMILSRIIADQVGRGAEMEAWLHERLFDHIGMAPMELGMDGSGVWVGGAIGDTTARSFARFGLLYLRGGYWEDDHVVPEWWVDDSFAPSPANSGYGYQWWRSGDDVFYALGFRGQHTVVMPSQDTVVVVLGDNSGRSSTLQWQVRQALADVVPAA